jgi:hypothetical protein
VKLLEGENETTEKLCPSCGHEKEYPDKKLCWYCYYRCNCGISKFILFKVMKDSDNKWQTREQLTDKVNEWRMEHEKPEVTTKAVYNILHRYSQLHEQAKQGKVKYLMLKRHKKTGKAGRPEVQYKLSALLLRRVDRHEKRILLGLLINSTVNKGKFRMIQDYQKRSRSIANRIKKGQDPYKYMIRDSY